MSTAGKRRVEILASLGAERAWTTRRLCEVCRDETGMTGAGIMLMSGSESKGSICTTDDVSALIEKLQYDLGEGPCIDACSSDVPVAEPDLAAPAVRRWFAFGPPAVAAGARAVFGFPVRVGAARLGALNLYRDSVGPLTDEQHRDALVAADIVGRFVLLLQANAFPGNLAAELDVGGEFHYVVHQAAGMVAAQLEIGVGDALVRLRAHAFGTGRDLTEVAHDVVARTLRFDAGADESDQS